MWRQANAFQAPFNLRPWPRHRSSLTTTATQTTCVLQREEPSPVYHHERTIDEINTTIANDNNDTILDFRSSVRYVPSSVTYALRSFYEQSNAVTNYNKCTYELGREASLSLRLSRKDLSEAFETESPDDVIITHDAISTISLSILNMISFQPQTILISSNCTDLIQQRFYKSSSHSIVHLINNLDVADIAKCLSLPQRPKAIIFPVRCPITAIEVPLPSITSFCRSVNILTIGDMGEISNMNDILHVRQLYHKIDVILCHVSSVGIILAKQNILQQLPPAIGGQRTFIDFENITETIPLMNRNSQTKWAPIPHRFECETATTSLAILASTTINNIMEQQHNEKFILGDLLYQGLSNMSLINTTHQQQQQAPSWACIHFDDDLHYNSTDVIEFLRQRSIFVDNTAQIGLAAASTHIFGHPESIFVKLKQGVHSTEDVEQFLRVLEDIDILR